jgi:hypothetical protein
MMGQQTRRSSARDRISLFSFDFFSNANEITTVSIQKRAEENFD